jgi:hypothetical protein
MIYTSKPSVFLSEFTHLKIQKHTIQRYGSHRTFTHNTVVTNMQLQLKYKLCMKKKLFMPFLDSEIR